MKHRNPLLFLLVSTTVCLALPFQVDWSVVGLGGSEAGNGVMSTRVTAGQTAAGRVDNGSFLALLGFWQGDVRVGLFEDHTVPLKPGFATRLLAPVPNPFSGRTVFRYSLAAGSRARLRIHDLTGRAVRCLVSGEVAAGSHRLSWNGEDGRGRRMPAGVYFICLSTPDADLVQRVVLTR